MKMVLLMYLSDDESRVLELLDRLEVTAFSRLGMEGRGAGIPGWYGEVAPYRSGMIFVLLPDDRARELLEAVRRMEDVADPDHPVHAVALAVEETANCGLDGTRP